MAIIGAPIQWPADNIPANTLILDGSELEVALYVKLYAVYGRIYTPQSTASSKFCLPDYRGRVVRGVDLGAGRDEGRDERSRVDGKVGDNVGSNQGSSIRSHIHMAKSGRSSGTSQGLRSNSILGEINDKWTAYTGGLETRCDNIALTFITFYE